MELRVVAPDAADPLTITEVVEALKTEGLKASHDSQDWGDWILLANDPTVISIESINGLSREATVEFPDDPSDRTRSKIEKAFKNLGWQGIDEDGLFPL